MFADADLQKHIGIQATIRSVATARATGAANARTITSAARNARPVEELRRRIAAEPGVRRPSSRHRGSREGIQDGDAVAGLLLRS
jgi:hypothetical protein